MIFTIRIWKLLLLWISWLAFGFQSTIFYHFFSSSWLLLLLLFPVIQSKKYLLLGKKSIQLDLAVSKEIEYLSISQELPWKYIDRQKGNVQLENLTEFIIFRLQNRMKSYFLLHETYKHLSCNDKNTQIKSLMIEYKILITIFFWKEM